MNRNTQDKEIDIFELLKKSYKSKNKIFYFTLLFFFIGISTSFLISNKYTSSTIFIPNNQESTTTSSLSGVASLVGINLGNSNFGGEIPSSMYPQILESSKFKKLLLSEIIDSNENLSLKSYLINYYSIRKDDSQKLSPYYVSELDEECFDKIDEILSVAVNLKDGFVTLTSTMAVPEYSAQVTNSAKNILQEIIIENKVESARQNLEFSENQLFEKKLIFDEIQSKLAFFSDSNLNSVNSFVINEKNKLEAEFEIINAVVTELSKQVEQAKLQVSKDTPVFSTVKDSTIPNEKSSPKRLQIVFIFTFLGFILGVSYSLSIDYLKKLMFYIKD